MKTLELHTPLIEQCIRGDRKAQYALYNQYAKGMYNVCHRMVGDKMLAEDIMQEAFVTVFKNLKSFKGDSTPGAWIKRIMVNSCINHLRKKKVALTDLDDARHYVVEESFSEMEVELGVKEIKDAMRKLPHGYKVVFSLYAIEGYVHEEIAEILDVSVSTSKSQYHRAKKKIKELITM